MWGVDAVREEGGEAELLWQRPSGKNVLLAREIYIIVYWSRETCRLHERKDLVTEAS